MIQASTLTIIFFKQLLLGPVERKHHHSMPLNSSVGGISTYIPIIVLVLERTPHSNISVLCSQSPLENAIINKNNAKFPFLFASRYGLIISAFQWNVSRWGHFWVWILRHWAYALPHVLCPFLWAGIQRCLWPSFHQTGMDNAPQSSYSKCGP